MYSPVAARCSACGLRPPSTGCRSSRMRRREFSAWGLCPSNRPFSSRSRVWVRPCTTCARRGMGSCFCGLAMCGPHRALAVGDERPQVSALPHKGPRAIRVCARSPSGCAILPSAHPLRLAAGTRRWGIETQRRPPLPSPSWFHAARAKDRWFPPCVEILYKRGLQSIPLNEFHTKQLVTPTP